MNHVTLISKPSPAMAQTNFDWWALLDWRLILDWWLYGLDYKLFFLRVIDNLTTKLA